MLRPLPLAAHDGHCGRHQAAAARCARRALTNRPDYAYANILLTSGLGHMERRAEAGKALAACEQLRPNFSKTWRDLWSFWPPEQIDKIADGLRKAGLLE